MSHQRKAVRHYAVDLLKSKLDVGGRVYANRPSPIFLNELPCALVFFTSEPVDIIVGDNYNPKEYQRNLRLNIDLIIDEPVTTLEDLNKSQDAEDFLDDLAWQVERAMMDDPAFEKLLPGYDPNGNNCSLLMGLRLISTDPYNVDTDGERRMLAQRLQFELPYETPSYVDKKYKDFTEYSAEFYEVKNGVKTEKILLAAEGKVRA